MALTSCPLPSNINPLSPNGFNFSITKLPEVAFFCQRVTLPTVQLGNIDQATPFSNRPIPGEIMTFSELSVQFLIDEQMANYKSIFDWMNGLGFPESYDQYKSMNGSSEGMYSELQRNYSDAALSVLDAQNNIVKTFVFYDLYPLSLDSIPFEATAMDVNYIVGNATFKYSYFKII